MFGRDEGREVAAVVGVRPAVELRVGEVRVDPSGDVGVRDRPRPIDPPRAVLADVFEQDRSLRWANAVAFGATRLYAPMAVKFSSRRPLGGQW